MKFLVKLLTFIFFLSWIAGPTYGQPKKRDRKVSFDCVVCHVTWHDDIDETKSLIPDIDAPIQIEGLPANIPTAAMLPEGGHEALCSVYFHERPAPFTAEIDEILKREAGEWVGSG